MAGDHRGRRETSGEVEDQRELLRADGDPVNLFAGSCAYRGTLAH